MKLRIVLGISVALLLAGLLSAADQQLLGLVMPDAKVIAGINVEQARISPFGQFVLSLIPAGDEGLAEFIAKTGFDPRQDLTEVLLASRGEPGPMSGLVLARGNFDPMKIAAAAKEAGGTVQMYNGVRLVTGKDESQTHALAFLDNGVALMGDLDSVRGAIDRRTAPTSLDPALLTQVNRLSLSEDAWTISTVPFAAMGKHADVLLKEQGNILKTVQRASGGVKFGSVIQIDGQMVTKDDKDASALADVIRFLAGMIQMNAGPKQHVPFAALLQNLTVTATASTVNVSLSISEDQLEGMMFSVRAAR